MSGLSFVITEEEQNNIVTRGAEIFGSTVIPTYSSIATQLVSTMLVAQQKPADFEQTIATQEVYCEMLKKLVGADEDVIGLEKIKALKTIEKMIAGYDEEIAMQMQQMAEPVPAVETEAEEEVVCAPAVESCEAVVEEADAVADYETTPDVVEDVAVAETVETEAE